MAGTTGTPARTQRLIALAATCLLGVVTAFALGRVFLGGAPTWRLVLAALACAGLACACERRNLAIAAGVSLLGLVVVIGILIFHDTTWHGVPTLPTLRAALDASRLVGQQARLQVSPTPPLQPLMLAAITATWAAVFSAHALAFRAGSPLLALLPPIALIAFADTVLDRLVKPIYGVEFLAAALLVIFADGIRRVQAWGPVWSGPGREARLTHTAGRGARRVAFAAVGVAVLAPLLIPGFGSKGLLDLSGHAHTGVNLDVLVSVANELKRDDPVEVFTVSTPRPTYYRVVSLPVYDGGVWRTDLNPLPRDVGSGEPLGPIAGLDPEIESQADTLTQTFHTSNKIEQPYVPMNYPPVSVDMGVTVHWDEVAGIVSLDGSIDAGADYQITSLALQPTPDELRALGTQEVLVDPEMTELPKNTRDELAPIAEKWALGAATTYDKVIAIQDHFLDEFTYDDTVPARENTDAMLSFLTDTKRGFCQQFSSAMAAMLRSIGIPARVAVGFTAGTADAQPDLWHVTTENAHAWVEVEFPQYGWLAFEPTPSRVNPVAASYADATACLGACATNGGHHPGSKPPKTQQTQPGKHAETVEPPATAGAPPVLTSRPAQASRRFGARRLLAAALLVVILAFLLIPVVRALGRRRRLRRAVGSPRGLILTTYDVFTERAGELGYGRPPGETLQEYRERVAASGRLRNGDLDRLTHLASRAAYAPQTPEAGEAEAATSAANGVIRDMRRGTPFAARVRGRYFPDR